MGSRVLQAGCQANRSSVERLDHGSDRAARLRHLPEFRWAHRGKALATILALIAPDGPLAAQEFEAGEPTLHSWFALAFVDVGGVK